MAKPKTWLGTNDRRARLREIEALDQEKDCREIARLFYEDFGPMMLVAAVSGFLLAYSAPRMSRILSSTRELEDRVAKRFLDTAILGRAVIQHGIDTAGPGRDAARRVSAMHGRYDIHPQDFVVFGTDQVVMSIELAEKYGWRSVTDKEREALRAFLTVETRYFGGREALPSTLPDMYALWNRYLDEQLAVEPQSLRMTNKFMDFLRSLVPSPFRFLVEPMLLAQIDPRVVRGCGKPVPGWLVRTVSTIAFRLVGRLSPPADDAPDGLQKLVDHMYPKGYSIGSLGTHTDSGERSATNKTPVEQIES